MRLVLDTNVVYQAFCSNKGASFAIFQLIRQGLVHLAISIPVFEEYRDVLNRADFRKRSGLSINDVQSILSFVAYIGHPFDIHYLLRPNLIDEADNMFIELAFASSADYLITNNIRHFRSSQLRLDSFEIMNPRDFMELWRTRHG